MDPQAALFELLSLLGAERETNRDRIEELLESLLGWIRSGGFLPQVQRAGARGFLVPEKGGAS